MTTWSIDTCGSIPYGTASSLQCLHEAATVPRPSALTIDDRTVPVALDTTVIVFADEPEKWGPHSRFIESARPDQQGRFTIRSLPPGRYVAIAVGYLEPGEEHDPDVL